MLRACAVVVILGAVSGPALAEPETIERDLRDLAMPDGPGRGFHAAAFAQLAGGTTAGNDAQTSEAALAVGGELRYSGSRCDYVRVGGQARLAYRGEARPSAEQWASVCVPIFIMELGHHFEWDVRPALLAPLEMRAGANRRETVTFRWQPLRMRLGHLLAGIQAGEAKKQGVVVTDPIDPNDPNIPSGDGIVFDTRVDVELLWSPDGELVQRDTADVLAFGYAKRRLAPWGDARDFTVDIGRAGGVFVDDVGASVRAWLLRLDNLAIGPVFATGGIGIVSASAGPFVDEYSREVDITSPRAELGLETGGRAVHGHVRATRDAAVVPDGYVTVDSRLAGGLGIALPRTRIGLDGAVAKTEVHVPGAMAVARVTGGGSLSVAHALTAHLDATVQLEVARSFYAANVTQLDFMPRWGANVFAAVQARIGR